MADKKFPSDIASTQQIFAATPVGAESEEGGAVPTQSFASFMKEGSSNPMESSGKTAMISPFDMMNGQPPLAQAPTLDTLMAQVNNAQSTMGDISSQLNTPKLKLRPSQKYLVKNKLSDAVTHLRSANAKMGGDTPPEPKASSFSGPLGRFFGYLTDGQNQLESAKNQLQSLKDKGDQITPGDFLLVQVKLNKATQELEYTSVLLSNAVSDLKMMMQVQL